MRPTLYASCLLVASRFVNPTQGEMSVQNVEQFEGSHAVLLYVTLHTIICAHTELLNDNGNAPFLYHSIS
jgi:hypothetical protein